MISSWTQTSSAAKRPFVLVTGWERYWSPRIRRWWLEDRFPIVEMSKATTGDVVALLRPGLVDRQASVLVSDLRGVDSEDKRPIGDLFEEALTYKGSSLLVYYPIDGVEKLSTKDQTWVRQARSTRFAHIHLQRVKWYDRRKRKWTEEMLRSHGLLLDQRASRYLLDWCQWDLFEVESQVIRLSLILADAEVLPLALLQKHLPERDGGSRALEHLLRVKTDGYYSTLVSQLMSAEETSRKRLLNQHLRLVDQVRVLLLVNPQAEDMDAEYDKLRKTTPYPMTRPQFDAMLRGPSFSKVDCLSFLSRSCDFLAEHFSN